MSKLYLQVTAYPGASIVDVAEQMARMAQMLNVSVWACLNGVEVVARPGDTGDELIARWQSERSEPEAQASIRSRLLGESSDSLTQTGS